MANVKREIEVKIIDIDRPAVEKRLQELGAAVLFDGIIDARYYDTPDKALHRQGSMLRLRLEGSAAVLTHKSHVSDGPAKVRDEAEITVSDFDLMHRVIEALGFLPWLSMRKHRTSYALNDVHVEIDCYIGEYAFIPDFLEIEGPSLTDIHACAMHLGYAPEDCLSWDAVRLAEHYRGKR